MFNTVYGLDLGFSKGKDSLKNKVLSVVKRRAENAVDLADFLTEGYLIELEDGSKWNVGQKGAFDITRSRLKKETDLPKLYTMLGLFQQHTGRTRIDLLVTGLPIADYMSQREALKASMEKVHHFKFNRKPVSLAVTECKVIPQAAGAYYDFVLDEDGMPVENGLAADLMYERVLILDIGGKTTDGCIMQNFSYSQDSFTIQKAVLRISSILKGYIDQQFNRQLPPVELLEAIETKQIKMGGNVVDIAHLVDAAVETFYPEFEAELVEKVNDDFAQFSAVILCGGGAYLLEKWIRETINGETNVIVMEDAEFSNAKGYEKFGKLMIQSK